jgi:hypothetical protein
MMVIIRAEKDLVDGIFLELKVLALNSPETCPDGVQ